MITIKEYVKKAISNAKDASIEIDIGSDDGIHVNEKSPNRIKFKVYGR